MVKNGFISLDRHALAGIRRWGFRLSGGLLDQICFSGANFLLHILLARQLSPDAYGGFVVAFSLLLFLITVHNALVLEPMNVIGPARFDGQPGAYFRSTLLLHAALVLIFSLVLVLIGYGPVAVSATWRPVFGSTALYAPLILTLWYMRRYCYYLLRPSLSLWGSAVYVLSIPVLILLMPSIRNGGAAAGMRIAGLGALAGCLALGLAMWIGHRREAVAPPGPTASGGAPPLRPIRLAAVWSEHWEYGGWLLACGVLTWINTSLFAPYLAIVRGLSDAAALRAVENLFMPMQQMLTAVAMMALPWIARGAALDDRSRFARSIARLSGGTAAAAVVYTLLIVAVGPLLFRLLYGAQTSYIVFLAAVPVMGFSVLGRAVGDVGIGCAVRVMRQTRWLFLATALSTLITLMFSYQAIVYHGVYGALIVRSASGGVYAVTLFALAGPYVWGRRRMKSDT